MILSSHATQYMNKDDQVYLDSHIHVSCHRAFSPSEKKRSETSLHGGRLERGVGRSAQARRSEAETSLHGGRLEYKE